MQGTVKNAYRTTYNKNQLIAGDTVCVAGQFIELGKLVVPVGSAYAVGFGVLEGQESASARFYCDIKSAANAAVDGTIRIFAYTPQDRPDKLMWEGRTENLRLGATDPRQRMVMPWIDAVPTEYWSIRIFINIDANITVSKANSSLLLDGTLYEITR